MVPADNQARQPAARDLDTTYFVEAAAGTGKTTALVSRIIEAVKQKRARLTEIVAITFTEKAAGELKVRLRMELEKALTGEPLRTALSDLERAHITTIHSFCAWLLRERPVEAAIDPQFVVLDNLQSQLLFDEAWDQWLESELAKNPPALRQTLMAGIELDSLLELAALFVQQRDRLTAAKWPMAQPPDVGKVVGEIMVLRTVLERCLKHFVARDENAYTRAVTFLTVLGTLDKASPERQTAILRSLELMAPKAIAHFDDAAAFREMKEAVKKVKALLGDFGAATDHHFLVEIATWLQGFVNHFQRAKHERAALDFDDLLIGTRDLLRDHTDVKRQFQERFQFVLVDEFQDTDPVQMEIVLALGEGRPGKLFIVGDPKQSIYAFRRADIEMYAGTRRQIEAHGKVLRFQQNFRSRSTILDWINDVFARILVRSTDGDYQPEYVPLVARPDLKVTEPRVTLLRPGKPVEGSMEELRRAEAAAVSRYLSQLISSGGCKAGDVALLFRSFTGVEIYTEVLQQYALPFRVVGGKGYYQRQEIQTLSSLLSCLDNPADKLNLAAVLRSPVFGWADEAVFLAAETSGLNYLASRANETDESGQETFRLLRELHQCRHQHSVAGYVEHVFTKSRICEAFFASQPDGEQCVANLLKALELARQFEQAGLRTLRAYVRRLRETVLGGVEEEPSPATEENQSISILTMHKAKGLEFPVVVLPDLAGRSSDTGARLLFDGDGTSQLRWAGRRTTGFDTATAELEKREEAEEIRLLYVAATRAKERLVIPWFAEKGERIDLLARGFVPAASALVEAPDLESLRPPPPESHQPGGKGRRSVRDWIAERETWAASRKELLARATQGLALVTPSKLSEDEVDESVQVDGGAGREAAMEFGSVVHGALEILDLKAPAAKQRQQIEKHVANTALAEAEKTRAVKMIAANLGSELLMRAAKAEEVYRELPFSHVTPAGIMEGKIDLLFRDKEGWTLVDYKTDTRVDVDKYTEQVRAYETALKGIVGIGRVQKLLYFLASQTVRQVQA